MATADYWSSADLKGLAHKGLIREDVMDKIFDISKIPLPFADAVGSGTASNSYTEWTTDKLAAPDVTNAQVDGRDSTVNQAAGGARVGNHCQISTKDVQVTTRAQESNTIGRANELSYQIMMRQQELRRDVDAICVSQQGSAADDGSTTPGKTGALGAWLKTNVDRAAGGASGGFAGGAVVAPTPGTLARAGSFAVLTGLIAKIWGGGGNPSMLMSTPGVIRGLSQFMFTDSAQIATLTSETTQSREAAVAKNSVNVLVTDFGVTVEMVPNRLQQLENVAAQSNLYILDPQYLEIKYLTRYRTDPLAKTGLADKRLMSVDYALAVLSEEAQGVYADLLPTGTWTA